MNIIYGAVRFAVRPTLLIQVRPCAARDTQRYLLRERLHLKFIWLSMEKIFKYFVIYIYKIELAEQVCVYICGSEISPSL